jgi:hypothetical protein
MATTFKNLTSADIASTRTLLHEAIPITGTVVSGTYGDLNIQNFTHQMFQAVYDYPFLSSSANHIFDIAVGFSSNSSLSSSAAGATQVAKKINMYNQLSQILVGYDASGSIQKFDRDGDLTSGDKIKEAIFLSFSRLLVKDEIKKGSFNLKVLTGSANSTPANILEISDYGAATDYRTNSPAGEYGILYTSSTAAAGTGVGLVYYQAGIAVLTASIFNGNFGPRADTSTYTSSVGAYLTSGSITGSCNGFRNRLFNVQFNNTTELNSTIYFCRANHNEFNYSSNPTYVSSSQIVVKNEASDPPISYVTTVGLYSADNELLAVAKLSEPLKKTIDSELTIRVRLDY